MPHESWVHKGGVFKHTGQFTMHAPYEWTEFLPSETNPETVWMFNELQRDNDWIYLYDNSRWYAIALGISNGLCYLAGWPPVRGPNIASERDRWKLLYHGVASHVIPRGIFKWPPP